jgi:hypothetical protein
MGYLRHKALLVHGLADDIQTVREDFVQIMLANYPELVLDTPNGPVTTVSEVVVAPVNGYASFMVAPDGSKEGWGASDTGDQAFEQFKTLIRNAQKGRDDYPEMGYALQWVDFVEVLVGGDDGRAGVLDSNLDYEKAAYAAS